MKNINLLNESAINHFNEIIESKQVDRKTRLKSLCKLISSRFDEYVLTAKKLEHISNSGFDARESEDLRHCYSSGTKALETLIAKIFNCQQAYGRSICGYCGINSPATTEHYLPQESFPEFSVCYMNLLPCCGECNTFKGSRWKKDTNERTVLNLYYDAIPSDQKWLSAKVGILQKTPYATFSIIRPPNASDYFFALVNSHYKTLNLLQRYSERAPEVFAELASSLPRDQDSPITRLVFKTQSEAFAEAFGINYWKSALFNAMSESDEYIDFVS